MAEWTDFAVEGFCVRFWVAWHGYMGEQTVFRVVRLGWVH